VTATLLAAVDQVSRWTKGPLMLLLILPVRLIIWHHHQLLLLLVVVVVVMAGKMLPAIVMDMLIHLQGSAYLLCLCQSCMPPARRAREERLRWLLLLKAAPAAAL
jgi:hypothetical protein